MIKVTLIGSGNVAQHLVSALTVAQNVQLFEIYSRNQPDFSIPAAVHVVHKIEELTDSDLFIISVSDSAISEISSALPFSGKMVVHTSGTLPLSALNPKNRRGVFYPLQTFSKHRVVDFKSIPICLESELDADYHQLEKIASSISNSVFKINSEQRKALHVAAVFASNFTNHLYEQASIICENSNVSFDILRPLIAETAAKIQTLSPAQAQTGPAQRNDQITIDAHLEFLSNQMQKDIYNLLTNSIRDGKKL